MALLCYNSRRARIMKIYTKSGDRGQTSLFGGQKVAKDNLRIETYGSVDELNSLIGVIVAELNQGNSPQGRIISKLTRNQEDLFVLGSDLATPLDVKVKVPRISNYY